MAARWLFPGLWCLADCCGRLEYRPKRIKMEIFPGDSVEVEPLLDELEKQGLISRYEVEGYDGAFIWIPKFTRHQNPHINEKRNGSKFPPHPDEPGASTVPVPDSSDTNHADSVILIPDSVIRDPSDDTERRRTEDGNGSPRHVGDIMAAQDGVRPPPGAQNSARPRAEPADGSRWSQNASQPITVKRILAATREPPEASDYWIEVARRLKKHGEEDAMRLSIRRLETFDNIGKPAAYLNRRCSNALKKHGESMPKSWKKQRQKAT